MASTNGYLQEASPSFLGRLLALPPLSGALSLTTGLYTRTKNVRVVGAVVGAAESSVRVAVTGVMPLATPILYRVEALDKWACLGLDTVEQMAPIVTNPTEVVKDVRVRVLGLLAGTNTAPDDVPLTLTSALTTRVHSTVQLVSGSKSGRAAVGVTECLLEVAHFLLDNYLPPGEGDDLQESNGRAGGVVVKASTLAHKTRRRLYRATHSALHPQHPDCGAASLIQLVNCTTEVVREWYWTPRPAPGQDLLTLVPRVVFGLTLEAWTRLAATLRAVLHLVFSFKPRSAANVAAQTIVDLRRDVAEKARKLLLHITIFCMIVEEKIIKFSEWSEERLRSAVTSLEKRIQTVGSLEEHEFWRDWLTAHLLY